MRGFSILVAALLAVCVLAGDCLAGGFGSTVVVNNRGFGRGRNQVFVNGGGVNVAVNNGRFRRNNVQVNVNGGFNRGNFNRGNFNSFRFNTFGTRTVVNNFGQVIEVDAFGNARVVASSVRGFGVSPFGNRFNGVGFNSFNSFGFQSFGGCH